MAEKIKINNNVFVYPMSVTLLGANVKGKANFMALGWVSRVNANPPMLGVGVHKSHYTPEGIMENRSFSVNFPYSEMVEKPTTVGLSPGKMLTSQAYLKYSTGGSKPLP